MYTWSVAGFLDTHSIMSPSDKTYLEIMITRETWHKTCLYSHHCACWWSSTLGHLLVQWWSSSHLIYILGQRFNKWLITTYRLQVWLKVEVQGHRKCYRNSDNAYDEPKKRIPRHHTQSGRAEHLLQLSMLGPLRWRHNGHDDVPNHQTLHCLLNRLDRRTSEKTSKLRVTGLWAGNSPVTGEFPAQMASDTENVSIWWRYHANLYSAQFNHFVMIYEPILYI